MVADGRMDGRTDGRMDGWTDGRADGWTDGRAAEWSSTIFRGSFFFFKTSQTNVTRREFYADHNHTG